MRARARRGGGAGGPGARNLGVAVAGGLAVSSALPGKRRRLTVESIKGEVEQAVLRYGVVLEDAYSAVRDHAGSCRR